MLLVGLRLALDELKAAGCRTVYVDGSFVTDKEQPGDFDACWERDHVDLQRVPPSLIAYDVFRPGMQAKYGGRSLPLTPLLTSTERPSSSSSGSTS